MLALVYGTSCSGKSTLAPLLAARRPELDVHDFDAGAGSPPLDPAGAKATESWIRRALVAEAAGRDAVLFGGVTGELLASPSAVELAGIALCLLDCSDEERVRRLRARYADEPLDPGRIERIDSTGEPAARTAARLDAWLTERQAERDAGLLPLSGRWWDYD